MSVFLSGLLAGVGLPLLSSPAGAAGADPQGTLYVTDLDTSSVDVFAPGVTGNVAPIRTIHGTNTGIDGPGDVKVSATGVVYVANYSGSSITEYAPGASGNASPICTLAGSNTELAAPDDMSLEPDGTLVVGNYNATGSAIGVVVFAPGQCGNVAPVEAIGGVNTGFNVVDGVGTDAAGTIYVDSTDDGAIRVFPAGASGNVAPTYSITGSNTDLVEPNDIVVGFGGALYVNDGFSGTNNVLVFAPGSMGNVAPTRDITGSSTLLGSPDDLAVDSSGTVYLTDEDDSATPRQPAVLEYSASQNGDVAPSGVIAGSATTFVYPEGAAVAGPPPAASATVTTQASSSAIGLGQTTTDVATISGGTTPSGALVFKLFGPNDPTCVAAPVYVTPAQTVSGDGNYASPSYSPTALGTYSWEALYSGDTNNDAVTTACGDPAETLTVSPATPPAPVPGHGAIGYRLQGHDGGVFDFGRSLFYGSLPQLQTNGLVGSPIEGTANTYDNGGYWLVSSSGGVFVYGDALYFGSLAGKTINGPIVGMAGTPDMKGYWLVGSDGGVYVFGDAGFFGSLGNQSRTNIVGLAATPDGGGYWLVDAHGTVTPFGDAHSFGSVAGADLDAPIVGIAPTTDGKGYWLTGGDGGVFAFGDAPFYGSMGGKTLNQPVIGIVPTPDGGGYWLVAADGGVFTFGDAACSLARL